MRNKKGIGALSFLQLAVLGLIIAVITLTVSLQVNDTMHDSLKLQNTNALLEDEFSLANGTAVNLLARDIVPGSVRLVAMWNSTLNATLIEGTNFTVNSLGGQITLIDANYDTNSSWANYTEYTKTADYNASNAGTAGLAVFADYWSVIAIIVVLALIILLFGMFGGGFGIGRGVQVR